MAPESPERSARDLRMLVPRLKTVVALIQPDPRLFVVGGALVALNRGLGIVLPACSKYFLDTVVLGGQHAQLPWVVAAALAATLCQGASALALNRLMTLAGLRLTVQLRTRLFGHVIRLPLSYFEATTSGATVARIMMDVEGVRTLVGIGFLQFVGSVIAALAALTVMLTVSVPMTLATAALIYGFGATLWWGLRLHRPLVRARMRIWGEVSSRLTDSIGGVRAIKGFRAEQRESEAFARGVGEIVQNGAASVNATAVVGLAGAVFGGITGAIIMLLGAHRLFAGAMPVGTYVMFAMLAGMLTAPVSQVVALAPDLLEAAVAVERTRDLFGIAVEDAGSPRRVIGRIRGHVAFEGVSHTYDGQRDVLHDVWFDAPAESVTALVGRSGAGKSSVTALLAGFYRPRAGRILVDELDIACVSLDSYRSQLGYVFQEALLFAGTLRDNVLFGRPGATEAQLAAACRIAHVDQFVSQLPAGYDTLIGERGVRLSGGQRQRISIARAVLADPRLLILDEATSSVDSASEALIQEGLQHLLRGRTTFVVAHRLSTIRAADQILVMDAGRVVGRGQHDQLLLSCALYRELWMRQTAERGSDRAEWGSLIDALEESTAPVAIPSRAINGQGGLRCDSAAARTGGTVA